MLGKRHEGQPAGSMPVCISCPLHRLSPTVCPDRPLHVCSTSRHLEATGPLCHLCRRLGRFQSSWSSIARVSTPIWQTFVFYPGLGPAQGSCWFLVEEDRFRLTSYPGPISWL